ncbi:MAG: tyrosine-type recombinase/integrase [Bacillota bacterium]
MDDLEIGDRYGIVVIRSGKGNKYREVPIPPEARKALKEWLAERDQKYPKSNQWLFPNRNGGHISTRHTEGIIKNYARFAGLDVHPHVLRHTCATNLIRSGYDLVADILRHANVSITAIYTKPSLRDKARALEISEV